MTFSYGNMLAHFPYVFLFLWVSVFHGTLIISVLTLVF